MGTFMSKLILIMQVIEFQLVKDNTEVLIKTSEEETLPDNSINSNR